ncbi:MAG: hypothetical protein R2911_30025 [Caldilineaceae bacterium]
MRNDRYLGVPGYESWWDVPVAEVSELDSVNAAREEWAENQVMERAIFGEPVRMRDDKMTG